VTTTSVEPRDPTLTSALSSAIVRVFAEHTGRGPTKARAVVARDVVTVVLEDTLTRGERNLVLAGQGETVIAVRRIHQQAMRADLVATVEELTGRSVTAFLSDQQVDPDVAVETFLLERDPQ
jgi:uncharacterized protein YbcI